MIFTNKNVILIQNKVDSDIYLNEIFTMKLSKFKLFFSVESYEENTDENCQK